MNVYWCNHIKRLKSTQLRVEFTTMSSDSDKLVWETCQKVIVTGLAHEIKNPLQMLQLGVKYQATLPAFEQHADVLQDIQRSSNGINAVTQALLDITHAKANPTTTSSEELFSAVTENCREFLATNGSTPHWESADLGSLNIDIKLMI